jgi:hypothetical protein
MSGFQSFSNSKDRIISLLKVRGPSLPVQISREINSSTLFTSAFLSELFAEKKLKISDMKVGSSPLYYLAGQEQMLENFSHYLNSKEKEAFEILKEKKILQDEETLPAIRVALRAIPDFAQSIIIKKDKEAKLYWKYFSLTDEEVKSLLSPPEIQKEPEKIQETKPIEKFPLEVEQKIQETKEEGQEIKATLRKAKAKKKPEKHNFPELIKNHLSSKKIEVLETILEKKKEFASKVSVKSFFGKQSFYLVAKDKKKVTENDINLALQKAQAEKMPAILISTGELDKKALSHIKEWENLIKFEKMNS